MILVLHIVCLCEKFRFHLTENTASMCYDRDRNSLGIFVIHSVFSILNFRWLLSTFIRVSMLRFLTTRATSPCTVTTDSTKSTDELNCAQLAIVLIVHGISISRTLPPKDVLSA